VLLIEIDDAIGLNAHAETRSDRNIARECFLAGWTGRLVTTACRETDDIQNPSSNEQLGLHKNPSMRARASSWQRLSTQNIHHG
jgi:hypothetical protein